MPEVVAPPARGTPDDRSAVCASCRLVLGCQVVAVADWRSRRHGLLDRTTSVPWRGHFVCVGFEADGCGDGAVGDVDGSG